MNGRLAGVVVVAFVLTACSSTRHTPAGSRVPAPQSVSIGSDQQRDASFIAALAASPYGSVYAARTREDLVRYAHDLCQQLQTPPGNGLTDIMGMTSDPAAQKFYAATAVGAYCPEAAGGLPNLIG